jgi:nucleoside-diphosphate-sugar epimerase
MKKILIIGGNRFVGLQLSKALQSNYQVTVFNRKGTGAEGVNIIQGDRNNENDIEKIPFSDFDVILDFCLFKPEQFELIKNKILSSTKYVFISSAAVYYEAFGAYGHEKQECENLIKSTLDNYFILRPPYIDGPGSHRPRIAFYLNQLLSNQPIPVNGNGKAQFNIIWVDDLVDMLVEFINFDFEYIIEKEYDLTGLDIINIEHLVSLFTPYTSLNPTYETTIKEVPYTNETLLLNTNELTKYFNTLASKIPSFIEWYNNEAKNYYGYETTI